MVAGDGGSVSVLARFVETDALGLFYLDDLGVVDDDLDDAVAQRSNVLADHLEPLGLSGPLPGADVVGWLAHRVDGWTLRYGSYLASARGARAWGAARWLSPPGWQFGKRRGLGLGRLGDRLGGLPSEEI